MKYTLAAFLLTVAASSPLFAADVINQDNRDYKLTIVEGSYTTSRSVSARGSAYGICSRGPCTIKVGGSSITVSKDDKVAINGGALKKR